MASPAGRALKQGRIYEPGQEGKMGFFPRWLPLKEKSRLGNPEIQTRPTADDLSPMPGADADYQLFRGCL
jgi:hypothetical protein